MKRVPAMVLCAVILAAIVPAVLFLDARAFLAGVIDRVGELGAWAPVVFIAVYAAGAVLLVPGSVLTLGAGFLFGFAKGVIVVSAGATLGATLAFLISRHLLRERVAERFGGSGRFRAMDQAIGREGWKIVLLARLSPVFPFNLLNYACGITDVSLRHYVLATWLGMLPGAFLYVYIGSLAGSLAGLGEGGRGRTPFEWAFYGVGLVATAAVVFLATRLARRALKESRIPG